MNQGNMSEKDGEKRYLLKYRETFSIRVHFRAAKAKTRAGVSQLKGRSLSGRQQAMDEDTNAVSCHGLRLVLCWLVYTRPWLYVSLMDWLKSHSPQQVLLLCSSFCLSHPYLPEVSSFNLLFPRLFFFFISSRVTSLFSYTAFICHLWSIYCPSFFFLPIIFFLKSVLVSFVVSLLITFLKCISISVLLSFSHSFSVVLPILSLLFLSPVVDCTDTLCFVLCFVFSLCIFSLALLNLI